VSAKDTKSKIKTKNTADETTFTLFFNDTLSKENPNWPTSIEKGNAGANNF
jgi:hypothetical protein